MSVASGGGYLPRRLAASVKYTSHLHFGEQLLYFIVP